MTKTDLCGIVLAIKLKGVIEMENERNYNDHFARDLVVKILFLALGVFLILWLMPKPEKATTQNVNLDPLLNQIFNQNIQTMKSTAKAYYTVERMPKEYNQKVSMTLGEMLDKHLLLPLIDKNNKECSRTNSYVEVTKQENDEYMLKVNLSCSDRTDYIIEYIGCYDFCKELSCGKVLKAVSSSPKAVPADGKMPNKPSGYKEVTEYEYYKDLVVDGWSPYGDWTSEYKQETATLKRQERTLYRAKVWVAKPVYVYEYRRNVAYYTDWSGWTDWTVTYKDANHVVDRQTKVIAGTPQYGDWTNVQEYRTETPMETYTNETERLFLTGIDQVRVCTEDKEECYKYKPYYLYRKQTRTKTVPNVTVYRYRTRSYNTYQESVWSYSTPGNTCEAGKACSNWVATGAKKQTSDKGQWIYTGWVTEDQIPAGYTVFETKKEYRYSVYTQVSERKYIWSEKTAIDGWTRTGRTRTKTVK